MRIWYLLFYLVSVSLSLVVNSCDDKKEDDAEYTFEYGVMYNRGDGEGAYIYNVYWSVFEGAGLAFNYSSGTFSKSSSKKDILKACEEAHDAILTSSYKFEGQYTYELKENGNVIFRKTYGMKHD